MPIDDLTRNTGLKSVYVNPLYRKLFDGKFEFDKIALRAIGQVFLKAVVYEAKKDFAKQRKSPHAPEGLPNSTGKTIRPSFFDSFKVTVTGKTFSVRSTWPWIENLIDGAPAGPMKQHTQLNPKLKGKTIPMMVDGKIIFRSAPTTLDKAWIHPGYAKHTFVTRGIERGKKELSAGKMAAIMASQLKRETKTT